MHVEGRFVIVEQKKPVHFLLDMTDPKEPKTKPLSVEVIDRGPNFVPYVSAEETVLARFVHLSEGIDFLKRIGAKSN